MPRLIVMSRRGTSRQVSLRTARTTLGRDGANALVIDCDRASRRHAVLIKEGQHVWVRDLDSSNGTFVNDERVSCCRLEHGDIVEVGDFKLRFLDRAVVGDSATMTLGLASLHGNLPTTQRRPASVDASAEWR